MRRRVLIATVDPLLEPALEQLQRRFQVTRCAGPAEARRLVHEAQREPFEALLGEAAGDDAQAWAPALAQDPLLALLLVVPADAGPDVLLPALRAGAADVLPRPPSPGDVVAALNLALERRAARIDRLRQRRDELRLCRPGACPHLESSRANLAVEAARRQRSEDELARWRVVRQLLPALPDPTREARPFEELLGASPAMRGLCQQLERAAASDASVVLIGETGTGKELCARAIHRRSARADRPCVAINCAALPDGLLESELFGHARGAFTDARQERTGLLQAASGGTLLLDEVGDMPLAVQAKLLRVLQERRVRPLGSDREVPVDLRLIAATHYDLEEAVREGRFREDLLYRINVIRIDVPPLRARGEDVLLLAQHHLQAFAARAGKPVLGLSPSAAERLLAYDWPGNVRELRNCMERAVAMTQHDQVVAEDLPSRVRRHEDGAPLVAGLDAPERLLPLEQLERQYVLRVLERVGGNKARAARVLDVSRKTLYRMLERYTADSGRLRLPGATPARGGASDSPGPS